MFRWIQNQWYKTIKKASCVGLKIIPNCILDGYPKIAQHLVNNAIDNSKHSDGDLISTSRQLIKSILRGSRDSKHELERLNFILESYNRKFDGATTFLFCCELSKYATKFQSQSKNFIHKKHLTQVLISRCASVALADYIDNACDQSYKNISPEVELKLLSTNFLEYLASKNVSNNIMNIVKNGDFHHTHGIEIFNSLHDTIRESANNMRRKFGQTRDLEGRFRISSNTILGLTKGLFTSPQLRLVFSNFFNAFADSGYIENRITDKMHSQIFAQALRADIGNFNRMVNHLGILDRQEASNFARVAVSYIHDVRHLVRTNYH